MIRKLFIVASGNTEAYRSLQNALGSEPDVAIIYDRRSPPARKPKVERRRDTGIDEEITAKGWAVVHNQDAEPVREMELANSRYDQLRSIWRMPGEPPPEG
jgi:hypothetical protein